MSETSAKYGPHQFEPTRPPAPPHEIILDGPLPELKCKLCGAWQGDIGDKPIGGINLQADTNLCGCNPINKNETTPQEEPRRERYGRHIFNFDEPIYMGDTAVVSCSLCGVNLIGVRNSGLAEPSGGRNTQTDPDLCGCHPLSQNELVDMTYRLELERDSAVKKLVDFKQKLKETIDELTK